MGSHRHDLRVAVLRARLRVLRYPEHDLSDGVLAALVRRVGDPDLTADAILMVQRPEWLEQQIGPFPVEVRHRLGEMLHPDDRTHPGGGF